DQMSIRSPTMYNVRKSFSRKKSNSAVALQPRVPRCVSEIHAARYRLGASRSSADLPNENRCWVAKARGELVREEVNVCILLRHKRKKPAVALAKKLSLHLCGN